MTASSSAGLVEYAVVSGAGDEVSASYLFELLQFRTTPNLRQSLLSARFASVNHSEPAMVLDFVDTDSVRGGLLTWETSMAEDFGALYDMPAAVTPDFVDDTIADVDVRILYHEDSVILVYGIIDENTALITSSSADFAQIVELGLGQ